MKKHAVSVALVLLLVVLSACNGDRSSPTEPGRTVQSFDLRVGQTVRLDGGDEVTLVRIVADSRCPINALCPQAGSVDAEIQVRQAADGTSSGVVRLELARERQEPTVIGRYAFRMGTLVKPGKTDSGEIPQSAYQITLIASAR